MTNELELQQNIKFATQRFLLNGQQQEQQNDEQDSSKPFSFNFPQVSMPNFQFSLPKLPQQDQEEKSTNEYLKSNVNTETKMNLCYL